MFLLTPQDVEIINSGKSSAILSYRSNRYRLARLFGDQRQSALVFARELIDQPEALCILLEEPHSYSVWSVDHSNVAPISLEEAIVQGGVCLLQQVNQRLAQELNPKRLANWHQELQKSLQKSRLPQVGSPGAIARLANLDPQADALPAWDDSHVQRLLAEVHRLVFSYLGNAKAELLINQAVEALTVLPAAVTEQFRQWLNTTPKGKLWLKDN